jgi:hypothetical protein
MWVIVKSGVEIPGYGTGRLYWSTENQDFHPDRWVADRWSSRREAEKMAFELSLRAHDLIGKLRVEPAPHLSHEYPE